MSGKPKNVFRRVFGYVMQERVYFFASIGLTLVNSLVNLVSPIIAGNVVDKVTANQVSELWYYAALVIGLTAAAGVLSFIRSYLGEFTAQSVVYRLRTTIYEHLQDLSYSFYDKVESGQIITRVTRDMDNIGRFLGFALPNLANALTMLAAVSIMLMTMNLSLALATLDLTPFIALVSVLFTRLIRPLFDKMWTELSKINTMVQETVTGFRVVKALHIEDEMFGRFEENNKNVYDLGMRSHTLMAYAWPSIGLVMGSGTAIIYWYGGLKVISNAMTLGELVSFTMYMGMLIWPIMAIGFTLVDYQQSMVSAGKVFEVLDTEPEVKERPDAIDLQSVRGDVKFDGVTFGYERTKPILKGLSFDVQHGEKVAIVGATGSGKSTVIKLIPRFYDPQAGTVSIDGIDLKCLKLSSLRRHIGIVHQDVFLFPSSIAENIAYGKPDATRGEIEAASKVAKAHDFILSMPAGYETQLGERGITLSGGQRQRVAIARALLINPTILILDDSTSSVDAETERDIYDALKELVRNRTVFIITQRLSTLRLADRIVVIEDGSVVEDGSHEELMKRDGLYAKLYMAQYAHQEVSA